MKVISNVSFFILGSLFLCSLVAMEPEINSVKCALSESIVMQDPVANSIMMAIKNMSAEKIYPKSCFKSDMPKIYKGLYPALVIYKKINVIKKFSQVCKVWSDAACDVLQQLNVECENCCQELAGKAIHGEISLPQAYVIPFIFAPEDFEQMFKPLFPNDKPKNDCC